MLTLSVLAVYVIFAAKSLISFEESRKFVW